MSEARRITEALGGRWKGRNGLCRCPAHADRRPSLSVADGRDGRLLLRCFAGCAFDDILAALRGLGLVTGNGRTLTPDPAAEAAFRAEEKAALEKRARQARAAWKETQPITGTVAEAYLRGRGIACALPPTLRFHPACWHATAKRFPALVALVEGGDGFAVHRTYLRPGGGGKADAEPARAMLGPTAGGAVRLTDGPGRLVVAEGIETALSLASGLLAGPARIWAALSTSGMTGLRLPDIPSRLTVAPDGDKAGHGAALALADRAARDGWAVSILTPPPVGDFNDLLRGEVMA
jgi:hypothetical protein